MSKLALLCAMVLALVAGVLDWWPPMQNGPKANYYEWTAEDLASRGESDTPLWLRPIATDEVSDRSGNHVADRVFDLGELAIAAGTGGDDSRRDEPATEMAVATWVHRSLDGGIRADGGVYRRDDPYYLASNDWPLGTVLVVSDVFTGVVQDRGLMGSNRLDMSEGGFQRLAPLSQGVITVTVRPW